MTNNLTIAQGDALKRLRDWPSSSVDLVCVDSPYPSLNRHREKGTTTRLTVSDASSNAWFPTMTNEQLHELIVESYRVLKPQRHMYFIADEETTDLAKRWAEAAGFYWWKTIPLVKVKAAYEPDELVAKYDAEADAFAMPVEEAEATVRFGMGYHYRNAHERALFLEKRTVPVRPKAGAALGALFAAAPAVDMYAGRTDPPGQGRRLNNLGIPDVLFCEAVRGGYPTEKDPRMLRLLVRQSTQPGEVCMDPCGGSGSLAWSAIVEGRDAVTFDLQDDAIRTMFDRFGVRGEEEIGAWVGARSRDGARFDFTDWKGA